MVTMRSSITKDACVYEIYVDNLRVWRRLVPLGKRNLAERRFVAREQERVSFLMAASADPVAACQRQRGPGTVAGLPSEATEIATSSGMYFLDLTATEMDADTVAIIVRADYNQVARRRGRDQ